MMTGRKKYNRRKTIPISEDFLNYCVLAQKVHSFAQARGVTNTGPLSERIGSTLRDFELSQELQLMNWRLDNGHLPQHYKSLVEVLTDKFYDNYDELDITRARFSKHLRRTRGAVRWRPTG